MDRTSVPILLLCLLTACQSTPSETQYDRVSREIDRLKAESEAAASMGKNIKVVVNMLSTNLADQFAINALWRYVNRGIAVSKRPGVFGRSGLAIGVGDKSFRARLDITKHQLKSSQDTELFIVLDDGATGYINIGEEIAVPRFYYSGLWYSSVGYQFRQAGRSLKVTARRLPSGLIDMELTPVFSRFLSNGGDLELTELSTRVTARPGRTIVIGGADTSSENVASALLSYGKSGQNRHTLITVTPHIQ